MKIVVLTGAGISAESGLSTFRDAGGLWSHYALEEGGDARGLRARPPRRSTGSTTRAGRTRFMPSPKRRAPPLLPRWGDGMAST